jgi:hyperosmotically inducible protein
MRHRYFSSVLIGFAMLLAWGVPAHAASQSESRAAASDRLLADRIGDEVRNYVYYTIFDDLKGRVANGLVTLTGKVTEPYKAKDIARLVKRVSGVREVDNKIEVLPVSIFDDELREQIASSIYRDPLFSNYAMQVNPPIHIVVDRGRVTLTGVVASEVERRSAEMKARSAFGAFQVVNKLMLDREMENAD